MVVTGRALCVGVCDRATLLGITGTVERTIGIDHSTLFGYRHGMVVCSDKLIPHYIVALTAVEHEGKLATGHLCLGEGCALIAVNLIHILALHLALAPKSGTIDVASGAVAVLNGRVVAAHPCADASILVRARNLA